jgi:hypothetical protein
MQKREWNDKLLDIGPHVFEGLTAAEIRDKLIEEGVAPEEALHEVNYLRAISRRKVKLPPDTYFAEARQRIFSRINIRPLTVLDRLVSVLIPASWKPIPAAVIALLIAVAILTPMFYHPVSTVRVDMPSLDSAGPHVSMSQFYTEHVVTVDEQVVSAEELREYREILLMSTAILGSPSSLSRSRSLAGSND